MHPVLFQVGVLKIYSYGLMILIAFGAALWLARKRADRYGFTPGQITDVAFWTLLAGVLGARIGFILQELPYYLRHRDQLFSWQFQGLTSYGGIIAGAIVLFVFARRSGKPLWNLLDLLGAPFLLGNAVGRVGCLLNGCCYGPPCPAPWGVHVEGKLGLFQPAQLYESALNLAAIWLLLRLERGTIRPGQSIGATLVLFGLGRFIYEFWRAGSSSTYLGSLPITDAQLVALILVVLGAIAWVRFGYSPGSSQEEPPEETPEPVAEV